MNHQKFSDNSLEGIIVALPIGFTQKGEIAFDAFKKHIDACIVAGVQGFWINGCTGLAVYLKEEERKKILEVAVEHVAGKVPIWVHVGAMTTAESMRLAKHAQKFKSVVGISTLPPLFYPTNLQRIIDHMTAIQEAGQLPITYYHVPGVTHVPLDAEELCKLCESVPNICGIKYSDNDLFKVAIVKDKFPHIRIMTGCEEVLLAGLSMGNFDGTVGASQNFLAPSYTALYRAFKEKDLDRARHIQNFVNRLVEIQSRYDFTSFVYGFLNLLGFDYGNPRAPMQYLNQKDLDRIQKDALKVIKPAPFEEKRLIEVEDFIG